MLFVPLNKQFIFGIFGFSMLFVPLTGRVLSTMLQLNDAAFDLSNGPVLDEVSEYHSSFFFEIIVLQWKNFTSLSRYSTIHPVLLSHRHYSSLLQFKIYEVKVKLNYTCQMIDGVWPILGLMDCSSS